VIDFFTKDSTGHAQISEVGYQEKPTLYKSVSTEDSFYNSLISLPDVTNATPRIVSGALAYGEVKSFPVQVIGVDVEKEANMSFLVEKVKEGQYMQALPDSDGYYQVLVGASVARQLNIGIADELILISQASDGSLANDVYLVSGIVGSTEGMEARNVYLPLAAAQDFFVMQNKAHYWAVLTDNYNNAEDLATQIDDWLAGDDQLESVSWKVVSKEFYETMQADIEGGYVAYYIIIFLVCIGVLNTVLMSVLERTGEFGVLKAIGTSPRRLFTLIVTETMLLAGISCLVGFLLVLPVNYYLAQVGFSLPEPMEVSGVMMSHMKGLWSVRTFLDPALIVIGSAAFISLFPARRAAKIVPVEAMRSL
jgi:ABC-type lipoprotein release transport system permease subunit